MTTPVSMAISIDRYQDHMVPAVTEFNRRLRSRGIEYYFPERADSDWLPPAPGRSIFEEYYLAREDDAVRGGYVFKHQLFALGGALQPIGNFRFPISEGLIDPAYRAVPMRLLRHALRRQPLLYSLGLGGRGEPVARLFAAAGFRLTEVPFYFKVLKARPFLRNIRALRTTRWRGAAFDLLAASGLGSLALFAADRLIWRTRTEGARSIAWERVSRFHPWADAIWRRALDHYPTLALRDAATLDVLYPPEDERFIRLRVKDGDEVVGWALLLDTRMAESKYFGDLRLASLVDCLAPPEAALPVALAALGFAREAGADLMVSNQGHRAFREALGQAGFVSGPSNFLLALSPALEREVARQPDGDEIHVNRGDGDGPVHL